MQAWSWRTIGLVGALAVGATCPAHAADANEPSLDAELLVHLDLMKEGDLARDRRVLQRLRIVEWLRMLETLPLLESSSSPTGSRPAARTVPSPAGRETR